MALLGIEEGIQAFLFPNALNNGTTNLKLHLYTNNLTPAAADVLASYTECADASYAAVALTAASWVLSSISGPKAQAAYPTVTFTFTSSAVLYGYYITDSATTKVIIAEKFSGAPITFGPTLPLALTLKVTLS